jgi:hypothetical protein
LEEAGVEGNAMAAWLRMPKGIRMCAMIIEHLGRVYVTSPAWAELHIQS